MKTFFNAIFQVATLPFVLAVDWLVLAIKLRRAEYCFFASHGGGYNYCKRLALARYCFKFSVNSWLHRLTGNYNAYIFAGV